MQESYLILPSIPTPNGPLHLGHIGGPYLSADICARHLRMLGHHAVIAGGVDSYDSFVIEAAQREGLTPEEVNTHYHDRIVNDIFDMHIGIDAFINPLSPKWHAQYQAYHEEVLGLLKNQNKVKMLSEYVPYDYASSRYLTGYAISGLCPYCHKNVAGYFCETCGAHFKPEEVLHKQSELERQVTNLFMSVPKDIALTKAGVSDNLHQLYKKVFASQNYQIRLTTFAPWGLPALQPGQVLFNYTFVYAYFLMLGAITQRFFDDNLHPFHPESKVKIISTMGIDNALPFIASISSITESSANYKAIDHYLINHFYHLNGLKFSSSKQHAIWVAELATQQLDADIVRFYLASVDVRNGPGNITKQKLIQCHDEMVRWLSETVEAAFATLNVEQVEPESFHHIEYLLSMQKNMLLPSNFLPHLAVKLVKQSLAHRPNFWWLKTWSIMLFPFMPVIAKKIWQGLGYQNDPSYADFMALPTAPIDAQLTFNLTVQTERMETCA